MAGEYFHIPIAIATTPANGEAICNAWWAVHPEKGVCFWLQVHGYGRSETPAPQCNEDEATSRHLAKRKPDHEVQFLPVVFMGHAVKEMQRIRRERVASLRDGLQKDSGQ